MKEKAGQVLFLSDPYAPQMGPTQASQGEGVCGGVDLHPSQAELAFTLVCDPICATDWVVYPGAVWGLRHVLTDGVRKKGSGGGHLRMRRRRGGAQGFCLEPVGWGEGSREEPNSRRPQCGSKEHETNHSGPPVMFAYACVCLCVCVRDRVYGYGCGHVPKCVGDLLSPSMQTSRCVPVFMGSHSPHSI